MYSFCEIIVKLYLLCAGHWQYWITIELLGEKVQAMYLPDHFGNLCLLHNFSIDPTFHDTALAHMTFETFSVKFAIILQIIQFS